MKQRRCGNCYAFVKLPRYGLCDYYDARARPDSRYARVCPGYAPVKFVRKQDKGQTDE